MGRKVNKSQRFELRLTRLESKVLTDKASKAGLTKSQFLVNCIFEKEIKERLTSEHIQIYRTLSQEMHNLSRIANRIKYTHPVSYQQFSLLAAEYRKLLVEAYK